MKQERKLKARIKIPKLYNKQLKMKSQLRRYNVINCGRRTGKTFLAINIMIEKYLLSGYPIAFCSPTYKMMLKVWKELKGLLYPIIKDVNEQNKTIVLQTLGEIDFWSLESADSMRGNKYKALFFDEAAMVKKLEDIWIDIARPTLFDYEGDCYWFSTPRGINYFKTLADKAQKLDNWAYFHYPTHVNPFISNDELEQARKEMTSDKYRQEILAEFIQVEGAMIKREWLKYSDEKPDLIMAVDLAISLKETADYTAICVMGKEGDKIIIYDIIRERLPFHSQLELIKNVANKYECKEVGIEKVAYQAAAIQELTRTTTLNILELRPDKDKVTRFQSLAARYEQGLVYHNKNLIPDFENELLAFPESEHDDMVDACSYAFTMLDSNNYWIDTF